jgi:hypothetical protein
MKGISGSVLSDPVDSGAAAVSGSASGALPVGTHPFKIC